MYAVLLWQDYTGSQICLAVTVCTHLPTLQGIFLLQYYKVTTSIIGTRDRASILQKPSPCTQILTTVFLLACNATCNKCSPGITIVSCEPLCIKVAGAIGKYCEQKHTQTPLARHQVQSKICCKINAAILFSVLWNKGLSLTKVASWGTLCIQ